MADDIAPAKFARNVFDDVKRIGDSVLSGAQNTMNAAKGAVDDVFEAAEQAVKGVLNVGQTALSSGAGTITSVPGDVVNDASGLLNKGKDIVDTTVRSVKPPEAPRLN